MNVSLDMRHLSKVNLEDGTISNAQISCDNNPFICGKRAFGMRPSFNVSQIECEGANPSKSSNQFTLLMSKESEKVWVNGF